MAVKKAIAKKTTKTSKTTKPVVKKTVSKVAATETHGLTAVVVDTEGKSKGRMTIPKEVFGEKMNKQLLAQAIRVYLANQREGSASTKTRGMVEGSTRKIYRQKGTGRARHGSIRAPIFVGGGIVFGPTPHSFNLHMPVSMKRKALACAYSGQFEAGNIAIVDGLETLKSKTKFIAQAMTALTGERSTLLIIAKGAQEVVRCARNIRHVDTIPATDVTTYDVVSHQKVVVMKDAVATIKDIITKK